MSAQSLISRYNHWHGKTLTVAALKAYRTEVENYLDSSGHGPGVPELKEILSRVTKAIKKANGYEVIEKVSINQVVIKSTPNKKAVLGKAVDLSIDKKYLYGLERKPKEADGLGFTQAGQAKIYDMITNMILNVIKESKELPWQKPWKIDTILATNFKTKTVYRGANLFLLNLIAPMFLGKNGPYWLTFKQIKDLGGTLKKGSKGFPVIYYSPYYVVNHPERKTISEAAYNELTAKQKADQHALELFTINYYTVFAQEDIDGIKFPEQTKRKAEPIESAQAIVDGMPNAPKIIHHKADRAFYSPSEDYIKIPEIGYFRNDQKYYSTLFHELIHATGHKDRLDRFEKNKKIAPKDDYAFEELIAEMGASYLNAEAGILYFTMNNSAAYLKGWKSKLEDIMKGDNKFFLKASAKAAQAADFILDRKEEQKSIPEKPVKAKAPARKAVKREKISAKDAVDNLATEFNKRSLSGVDYRYYTHDLGRFKGSLYKLNSDSVAMFSGLPGHGKTVLMLQLAQHFAETGKKTLYVSEEEYGKSTLDEKIQEFNIGHNNLTITGELNDADLEANEVIFLDSVSSMGLKVADVKALIKKYRNRTWILIVQSTKDGGYKGGQDWSHLVDVVGKVSNRVLILTKNRYDKDNHLKLDELTTQDKITEMEKKAKIRNAVKERTKPVETKKEPVTLTI